MATYPLSGPPVRARNERLTLIHNQTVQSSEFAGNTTVIDKYSLWTLELDWPPMTISRATTLAAWIDLLRGSLGTFVYRPVLGVYGLASKVVAQPIYPMSVLAEIGGWSANAATGLKVGQFFSIGGQLHRLLTAPAVADANGRAVIEFANPVRALRPAGNVVEFNNPTGMFRRAAETLASGFSVDPNRFGEFATFTAMEVI